MVQLYFFYNTRVLDVTGSEPVRVSDVTVLFGRDSGCVRRCHVLVDVMGYTRGPCPAKLSELSNKEVPANKGRLTNPIVD
jgi:hypothetical protein